MSIAHCIVFISYPCFIFSIFSCSGLFNKSLNMSDGILCLWLVHTFIQGRTSFPVFMLCTIVHWGDNSEGHSWTLPGIRPPHGDPCVPVRCGLLLLIGSDTNGWGAMWRRACHPPWVFPPGRGRRIWSSLLSLPLWVCRTMQPCASSVPIAESHRHRQHCLGILWCAVLCPIIWMFSQWYFNKLYCIPTPC